MIAIVLNTILLMCKTVGESPTMTYATEILNYIFTAIFTCEMFLKLSALGFHIYFRERWN